MRDRKYEIYNHNDNENNDNKVAISAESRHVELSFPVTLQLQHNERGRFSIWQAPEEEVMNQRMLCCPFIFSSSYQLRRNTNTSIFSSPAVSVLVTWVGGAQGFAGSYQNSDV